MRLDPAELETAGYSVNRCRRGVSATDEYRNLYQKAIRSGDGTRLYFVNVWEYDWRRFGEGVRHAAEVQFRKDELHVNVEPLFGDGTTIDEVEAFFAMAYDRMECTPYDAE